MEAHLTLLEDCYVGLLDKKGAYLPKAMKEPESAYKQRVDASTFNNKVKPTIDSNAGLLTAFETQKLPSSLKAVENDVDLKGSNFKSFFQEADKLALRDRFCFIKIDAPELNEERTAADAIENPRRPYLSIIERKNVLNWRKRFVMGRCVVDSITFQLEMQEPDGQFGVKSKVYYHQLTASAGAVVHQVWSINDRGDPIAEGQPKVVELPDIPIVCYPCTSDPFNTDTPPFYKLATLNIKLFRKESTLDEIEYRVNCPTIKRMWPQGEQVPANPPAVTLGSTHIIEVPFGGDVGALELSGSGIASLQNSINELKQDIESESMAFLQGSTVQRTATESFLSSSQVQASLNGYMRDKEAAIREVINHWCEYTGEQNTVEFEVDHSVLEMPLDSGEMGQLLQFFNAGVISHYHLLTLLKMGRQLPPNVDVDKWVEEVRKERDREMEAQPIDNVTDLSAYLPSRQSQQVV